MVKIAEEWLSICGGCECNILDIGEPLLDILPKLEFVHMPVIMDSKYYGQTGDREELQIPEADVGLIAGCVRNEENKAIAEEMRRKCKTIIAYGSCAVFGGVPALGNLYHTEDILKKVYQESKTTEPGDFPSEGLPPLMDRVYALDEVIKVDMYLPGCPTSPDMLVEALTALLENKPFELPEKSVCDDCSLDREKKAISTLKRHTELPPPHLRDEPNRCILEQGYLCLGPATRSGCGGKDKTPRCIRGGYPCRGCFGPVRFGENQMVAMMGALSTLGIDARTIPDRLATFNQFVGGHGTLKAR